MELEPDEVEQRLKHSSEPEIHPGFHDDGAPHAHGRVSVAPQRLRHGPQLGRGRQARYEPAVVDAREERRMTRIRVQLGDARFCVGERRVSEERGDHEMPIGIDLITVQDASSAFGFEQGGEV